MLSSTRPGRRRLLPHVLNNTNHTSRFPGPTPQLSDILTHWEPRPPPPPPRSVFTNARAHAPGRKRVWHATGEEWVEALEHERRRNTVTAAKRKRGQILTAEEWTEALGGERNTSALGAQPQLILHYIPAITLDLDLPEDEWFASRVQEHTFWPGDMPKVSEEQFREREGYLTAGEWVGALEEERRRNSSIAALAEMRRLLRLRLRPSFLAQLDEWKPSSHRISRRHVTHVPSLALSDEWKPSHRISSVSEEHIRERNNISAEEWVEELETEEQKTTRESLRLEILSYLRGHMSRET
ncbi:hypothetical protein C8J57DRAFT_1283164 [Mycena rebaudengoi]|nr:hypothetical protein C8J57DRAFT_1283164 [Mycena rebaudengoi]